MPFDFPADFRILFFNRHMSVFLAPQFDILELLLKFLLGSLPFDNPISL